VVLHLAQSTLLYLIILGFKLSGYLPLCHSHSIFQKRHFIKVFVFLYLPQTLKVPAILKKTFAFRLPAPFQKRRQQKNLGHSFLYESSDWDFFCSSSFYSHSMTFCSKLVVIQSEFARSSIHFIFVTNYILLIITNQLSIVLFSLLNLCSC
jgi:hypothetical protein